MSLNAYQDSVGVWTIGYGHTGPEVHEGLTWTTAQADDQLNADINEACEQMLGVVTVEISQGVCDALTDFTFNLGIGNLRGSTLLKKLNSGDSGGACRELYWVDEEDKPHGWIYAGGVILPGLVTRRQDEQELWNG